MKQIQNPKNTKDACEYVKFLIEKVGSNIKKDTFFGEIEDEDSEEPYIILKEKSKTGKISETGCSISLKMEEKTVIGRKVEAVQYYVQHGVIIYGVSYYPDGSGEPDSHDYVDDLVTDSPMEAVKSLILSYLGSQIDHMYECMSESDLADEMAVQMAVEKVENNVCH